MGQRAEPRARYYRYGGLVVRVYKGRLEVVRVAGAPVEARPGRFPRAACMYTRLPKRYRRQIRESARRASEKARRKRLEAQGVELPADQGPLAIAGATQIEQWA